MKLVVGLGNPGRKYVGTRHNIGFEVVRLVAERSGLGTPRFRFDGETVEARIGNSSVLLLCPHTYMNKSGDSVKAACGYYDIDQQDVLVVCDDFHLPLARLRFRAQGTSGGQKGLKHIIQRLGSEQVSRLRFGVGEPPERWNPADYVLSKFAKSETDDVRQATELAADAVGHWVTHGIDDCMNKYNSK